jgi:hypothetical protein
MVLSKMAWKLLCQMHNLVRSIEASFAGAIKWRQMIRTWANQHAQVDDIKHSCTKYSICGSARAWYKRALASDASCLHLLNLWKTFAIKQDSSSFNCVSVATTTEKCIFSYRIRLVVNDACRSERQRQMRKLRCWLLNSIVCLGCLATKSGHRNGQARCSASWCVVSVS